MQTKNQTVKFFKEIITLEELKKCYKILAKQFHPDLGGDVQTMQELNNEYDFVFDILKNSHNTNAIKNNSKKVTEFSKETREIIEKIIILEGIQIEICGSWLWITGKTYDHKDFLSDIGFKWSKAKKSWYWSVDITDSKKVRGHYNMEKIREKYGSEKLESKNRVKIGA
jgi:hypothetical protein